MFVGVGVGASAGWRDDAVCEYGADGGDGGVDVDVMARDVCVCWDGGRCQMRVDMCVCV